MQTPKVDNTTGRLVWLNKRDGLQFHAAQLTKLGKADEEVIEFDKPYSIGENDMCIDAIDSTGTYVRVDICGVSDSLHVSYLADSVQSDILALLHDMEAKASCPDSSEGSK